MLPLLLPLCLGGGGGGGGGAMSPLLTSLSLTARLGFASEDEILSGRLLLRTEGLRAGGGMGGGNLPWA
jgi:hypothetical protein